jgi:hypothetical protein
MVVSHDLAGHTYSTYDSAQPHDKITKRHYEKLMDVIQHVIRLGTQYTASVSHKDKQPSMSIASFNNSNMLRIHPILSKKVDTLSISWQFRRTVRVHDSGMVP